MVKTVIRGVQSRRSGREEQLWVFFRVGAFCESAQPNEILHNHMAGL